MRTVYLDIETGPLPMAKREFARPKIEDIKLGNLKDPAKIAAKQAEVMAEFEAGTDAALDPLLGRVLLIGYAIDSEPYQAIHDEDEGDMLLTFLNVLKELDKDEKHNLRIVGHNVVGFDGPFLVRRGFVMDARWPAWLVGDLAQYRPQRWVDTMRIWGLGDRQAFTKLERLCGAFGIPVKNSSAGVTGATFSEHWRHNKEACIDYNRDDVEATRQLFGFLKYEEGF